LAVGVLDRDSVAMAVSVIVEVEETVTRPVDEAVGGGPVAVPVTL